MTRIYKALGLMSGTSMDGIDIALIETDGHKHIEHIDAAFFAYETEFQDRLRSILGRSGRDEDMRSIEDDLTSLHSDAIQHILSEWRVPSNTIDIIGFHGHTIFHDPENNLTLQIGDGERLAKELGIDVVYDFRQADIKNGGEGAPLAPIYHWAVGQNHKFPSHSVIVNIGGVSNITYLAEQPEQLIAFDTGPGNALIDDCMRKNFDEDYDEDGDIAAEGTIDQSLLTDMMTDTYFDRPTPKSLDRDHFISYMERIEHLDPSDQIATLTALTVHSLVISLNHLPETPSGWIVTGGGRHNTTMMRWLKEWSGMAVKSIDDFDLDGDSVEAELFGYIAVRHLINKPSSFPRTTGCQTPTVAGQLIKV